jgi:predicted ATP-dependent endonuclease of OLD family
MAVYVEGWQRLVNISDAELRGSNEDTIDEYYAFLLTNKLQPSSEIASQPTQLVKLITSLQTIMRLKDAEFQDLLNAYEQEQEQRGKGGNMEADNERHIRDLEKKLREQEVRGKRDVPTCDK